MKKLTYFWQSNISKPGMIYNFLYVGPVWSRNQISAFEASRQTPQSAGEQKSHMIFVTSDWDSSYQSTWMSSMPCPFAPGSPAAVNTPNTLCLPGRPLFPKIRLFILVEVKLGKLVHQHKGPFRPMGMPAVRLNFVMTSFIREQLLTVSLPAFHSTESGLSGASNHKIFIP